MIPPETIRNRLLKLIAVIMVVAGLYWSYPVTMPLVVAVFIIAAAWPIKPWLERMLPSSLSYVGAVRILSLILAGSSWSPILRSHRWRRHSPGTRSSTALCTRAMRLGRG